MLIDVLYIKKKIGDIKLRMWILSQGVSTKNEDTGGVL